jgi:hypothetical protein
MMWVLLGVSCERCDWLRPASNRKPRLRDELILPHNSLAINKLKGEAAGNPL